MPPTCASRGNLQRAAETERTLLLVDDESNIPRLPAPPAAPRGLHHPHRHQRRGRPRTAGHPPGGCDHLRPAHAGHDRRRVPAQGQGTWRPTRCGWCSPATPISSRSPTPSTKARSTSSHQAVGRRDARRQHRRSLPRKLLSDENRRLSAEPPDANSELERINAQLQAVAGRPGASNSAWAKRPSAGPGSPRHHPAAADTLDPTGMIALANGAAERCFPGRARSSASTPSRCCPRACSNSQRRQRWRRGRCARNWAAASKPTLGGSTQHPRHAASPQPDDRPHERRRRTPSTKSSPEWRWRLR